MSQQYIQQVAVPGTSPYTVTLQNTTGAALVDVQTAAGTSVTGCTISAGVVTFPSSVAGSTLWVVYTATGPAYSGSKAQAGRGSTISINGTLVGEVTSISLGRGKWQTVSVTNFQSGLDEELLQTIRKAGTVGLKGNRVSSDAGQVLVEASYQSGGLQPYVQQLPINALAGQTSVGDKYEYNAFVISSDFTDEVDKAVEFTIELQISGGAPLTVGS